MGGNGINCPICRFERVTLDPRFHLRPSEGRIFGLRFLRCPRCGLGFFNPLPSEELLARYVYNESYPIYRAMPREAHPSIASRAYRLVFPHPIRELLPANSGRVLDVGCGNGYWLRELSGRGWEAQGLDINEGTIKRIRLMGFKGICGKIEEVELPRNYFDLVLLAAVLEHVHDPIAAIHNVWSTLKPGGHLVVHVPNFASPEAGLFRSGWSLFGVDHLFYYTEQSLRRLLLSNGFTPEAFICSSADMTFGFSFAVRLNLRPRTAVAILLTPVQLLLNTAGRSGELFCRASKRER